MDWRPVHRQVPPCKNWSIRHQGTQHANQTSILAGTILEIFLSRGQQRGDSAWVMPMIQGIRDKVFARETDRVAKKCRRLLTCSSEQRLPRANILNCSGLQRISNQQRRGFGAICLTAMPMGSHPNRSHGLEPGVLL